jgi:hypothetical protein
LPMSDSPISIPFPSPMPAPFPTEIIVFEWLNEADFFACEIAQFSALVDIQMITVDIRREGV